MEYGYFSVKEVLEYIKKHPRPPTIPRNKDARLIYNTYKSIFQPLLQQVPEISGWYAWLKINNDVLEVIYVGKSARRKTSNIRARLDEEFRDEGVVTFWATVHEEIRNWNPTWKYANETKRALRKAGVTHIIWFGKKDLTEDQVKNVESNLIKRYAPTANVQRKVKEVDPELMKEANEAFERALEAAKSLD